MRISILCLFVMVYVSVMAQTNDNPQLKLVPSQNIDVVINYDTILKANLVEIVCIVKKINTEDVFFQYRGKQGIDIINKHSVISIKYANGSKTNFRDILTNEYINYTEQKKDRIYFNVYPENINNRLLYKGNFIITRKDSVSGKLNAEYVTLNKAEEYLKNSKNSTSYNSFLLGKSLKQNKLLMFTGLAIGVAGTGFSVFSAFGFSAPPTTSYSKTIPYTLTGVTLAFLGWSTFFYNINISTKSHNAYKNAAKLYNLR